MVGTGFRTIYYIRLKFSNFFIHHYFQSVKFENCQCAFKMLSDGQMSLCVFLTSTSCYATFKNRANHVPSNPHASPVIIFCIV